MAINRWLGLGFINNPYDVAGLVTVAPLDGDKARIIVDHAKVFEDGVSRITNFSSSPVAISDRTLPPWATEKSKNHPLLVPEATPMVLSKESALSHSDTLFRDFDLQCQPFYNFWVSDEETNDEQDVGDRKLVDVPRYVRLSWKRAPDLPGEPLKDKDGRVRRKVFDKFTPNKSFYSRGVDFTPDHLQAENFQIPRLATANGFLSPGVLSAVVEIPDDDVHDVLDEILDDSDFIDEDAFLDHPDTDGMSIFELKMNVQQANDPLIQSSLLGSEGMDNSTLAQKSDGFDGRYSIQRPAKQGDFMRLSGIDPGSGLTMNAVTAHTDSVEDDHVIGTVRKISEPPRRKLTSSTFAKVKFIDPGVVNISSTERLMSIRRPEHAENLLAISTFLPNLAVMSYLGPQFQDQDFKDLLSRMPSFAAPAGLKPLEYVGYVIEKSQMKDGTFEVVDTIEIPDIETTEYYDSRVLYGETYRYRIKTIFRWTREADSDYNQDVFVSIKNSQTNKLFPYKSSYFHSEWSAPWQYASILDTNPPPPPDELVVRPESARKRIIVTMKYPEDSQRDILKMRLYRKLQTRGGEDLTGWDIVADNFPPKNSIYVDSDVDFVEENGIRYVYAAQTVSRHKELSTLSEQLAARLNRNWKIFGEHPTEFVSNAGVKTSYFGAFSVKPFAPRHVETIVPFRRFGELSEQLCSVAFAGRERLSLRPSDDRTYVIRAESLDTGEIVEDFLSLRLEKVKANLRSVLDSRKLSIPRPMFDKLLPSLGKLF
jgi:hypothetical protein